MEHLKIFESIPLYNGFYSSKVCILLITTPIGKSVGFYQNNNSKFYCGLYLISTDNLKTLDFSKFNTVVVKDLYDIIDTWEEGSIVFNSSVATYLKGILVLGNKAHWEDNVLVAGSDGSYYYEPEFNGLRVWYNDGNVVNYDVSVIENNTIQNHNKVVEAVIGSNVTRIGNFSFEGCRRLTSISVPNSVTDIGQYAFCNCSGLTSIDIPNSVTNIRNSTFSDCSGLTSVTIPNSVTSIGSSAFYGCSGLTSVTIPNSVTSIGSSAFYGCSGLTSVTIPNSVTSIGQYAFYGCIGLTSVIIGNNVTSIGSSAFSGCSSLTSVTLNANDIVSKTYSSSSNLGTIFGSKVKEYVLGNDVKGIGSYAFYKCSGLTSVTIPNSVTSIGKETFYNCSGLTSVTIPNSVTSIGGSAFSGCSGLTSLKVEEGNPKYDSRNNCNAIIESFTNTLIAGCKTTTIPNSVTSIGQYAFYGCSGLTSVTIPNSVTSIGSFAFYGCTSLTSVNIPNSITSIGYDAFSGCSSLSSVTIPNSVTSIGYQAFWGTAWFDNQPDGLIYAGKVAYKYKGTMPSGTNITLYEGTLGIAGYAFLNCSGLTSVTIPNSVTSIGRNAFYGCSELTSIDIPNSVTSIGSYAFGNCSSLTHIYCDELQIQLDLSYLTLLLDAKSLNTIVDNWKEGASIVFSSENAINLKGKLVIGDRAYWDGDTLKYGKGGGEYYPTILTGKNIFSLG